MRSITEFANTVGVGARPISLLTIQRKFKALSLRDAIATRDITDFHRRTGADYGPLGVPLGGLSKATDGSYVQSHQLGVIKQAGIDAAPVGETEFAATVTLSAIHCFGTQDKDGSDSAYAVISVFAINPNHAGSDQLARPTILTEIVENVHAGDTILKMRTLGDLIPAGSGIQIHVAIWDHESGNANDIRDKIQAAVEDAVNKGASALGSAAQADDPAVSGGTAAKLTDFEVLGVKPFHFLTLGIAKVIGEALADDLIGEQSFFIPAANIVNFADQTKLDASIRSRSDLSELPFDVQVNWPPTRGEEVVFTDGQGTYKAYFLIQGGSFTRPTLPALS